MGRVSKHEWTAGIRRDIPPPAGLDDQDYRRETKRRYMQAEQFNDRLRAGFAAMNGEGVYVEDEPGGEDD